MANHIRHLRSAARRFGLAGRGVLAVLVPPLCVACDTTLAVSERWLCGSCNMGLSRDAGPRSRTIGLAGGRSLTVRYALSYTARVSKVITQMKYTDKPGLAEVLVDYLSLALGDFAGRDTAVLPVPMHPVRVRERGYNQSELLGSLLSEARGWSWLPDVVLKRQNTASQTAVGREARPGNVAGSFSVRCDSALNGRSVVIVDDVVTTGSTLRECAEALRSIDAGEISACVVASSL